MCMVVVPYEHVSILFTCSHGNGTERNGTERNGTERNGTGRDGTERNGTERNGTERNGTEKNGTERNDCVPFHFSSHFRGHLKFRNGKVEFIAFPCERGLR